jgi:hypothetical protein
MRFFLSKDDVRYHEVVSYSEVQDVFSLLILFAISKTLMYSLKLPLIVPTRSLISPPMKSFSLLDTHLTMSSKSSQNRLLISSLKPTCGAYTLMTFKTDKIKRRFLWHGLKEELSDKKLRCLVK